MKEYTSWIVLLSFFAVSLIVIFIFGLNNIRLISERDALLERLEWQADSLRVYEIQWAECQEWNQYIKIKDVDYETYMKAYRSIALNCAKELRFFRPESTQVVDGVLLERSKSSQTAWNAGVADEH